MVTIVSNIFSSVAVIFAPAIHLPFLILFGLGWGLSSDAHAVTKQNAAKWEVHSPGGETSCALGSEFRFYSRKGNPEKLLVYFTGGGACWNGQQCNTTTNPTPYSYDVNNKDPRNMHGIFNLNHPDNPFADYTIVMAPTCTGDVVLGDSVFTYHYQSENNERETVTVHHKGYVNGMATLQWAVQHIKEPEIVVVGGSSAGGIAAPFYANVLANHYPNARVIGIGDGAGAYREDATSGVNLKPWNIQEFIQNHPAFNGLEPLKLGIEKLFIAAAGQNLSNLELYQVDQAYDNVQQYFLALAGNKNPDVLELIRKNRREIRSHYPGFRSFTIGGVLHTVLPSDHFYYYQTEGKLFLDWLKKILDGFEVENIDCTDCTRPGLQYTETDLAIIQKMKALLSDEAHWNPNDNFQEDQSCSQTTGKYSLRCALTIAQQEPGGPLVDYPSAQAVWYLINKKMENKSMENTPLWVQYNNATGRNFQDILNIIEEVENEIRAQLNKPANQG
jgi:hypothetical protein